MRKCCPVGTKVVAPRALPGHAGKVLTVVKTEPWTPAMCDTLVEGPDGYRGWYAAHDLRPVCEMCLGTARWVEMWDYLEPGLCDKCAAKRPDPGVDDWRF